MKLHEFKVEKISKSYNKRKIIEDVSFNVKSQEIVGLLGPNGAGKTTSFYAAVGLVSPDSGSVFLDTEDLTHVPIHKRALYGIGYLPQNSSIFKKMSVEDNLLAIMEVIHTPKKERPALLEKLIEQFGIGHIRKSLGYMLSGGERRRVEIARTLVLKPKFLLLDEPFAGIDPVTVGDIQNLIKNLVRDEHLGVLITDHNVRETLTLCNRAYILAYGKILFHGEPSSITKHKDVKKIYLGEQFSF
jgi:lipopolysaccharide export system ATP-binding protein